MLKDCLQILISKDNSFKNINRVLENIDEDQLAYILSNGLSVNEFKIFFYKNIGFRCININEKQVGKLPTCKYVEKILNDYYIKI